MTDTTTPPAPERRPIIGAPTTIRGKIGCALGLVIWFSILLTPCAMFWLASGNSLIIHHGSVPDPESHPLLEIGLFMDADNSGFKIIRSQITTGDDTGICMQTTVNYLLWQSSETGNPDAVFCDCYLRDESESPWQLDSTTMTACETP